MPAWVSAAIGVAGLVMGSQQADAAGERQDAATAAGERASDRQAKISERQQAMSEEQYSRYKATYQPLEEELVNQARDYGSNANREKAAATAKGDVTSSFAGLRERLNSTPGLDPSSAKYLDTMTKVGVQEAGASAAAANGARDKVDAVGTAKLSDAVSLGKGLPGSAAAMLAGASSSQYGSGALAGSIAGIAGRQLDVANQGLGGAWSALGTAASNPGLQKTVGGWFGGSGGGLAANDPYGFGMTNGSTDYGIGANGVALTKLPTAGGG